MKPTLISLAAVWALSLCVAPAARGQSTSGDDLKQWGLETLQRIQSAFQIPARNLYAEEFTVGQPAPDRPAFMWGCGVQLAALSAAARLDKTYELPLRQYAKALDGYWTEWKGVGGYDVLPGPKSPDRYYDDNAWIALDLAEIYEMTHDVTYLKRARETLRFILSGEDDQLGGGVFWHENKRDSKNTCSNAPAAAAALRLYQLTNEPQYLAAGKRLVDWTTAHLQDTDGLFFDNIKLDGSVEKTKWSYNTALMIRANCLLYAITGEQRYLQAAQRSAHAAVMHWIRPDTGAVADIAPFAHLLLEAFLYLYDQDKDPNWPNVVHRALVFLHDRVRDPNGFYGDNWATPQTTPKQKLSLLYQASAARAFLAAARYPSTVSVSTEKQGLGTRD